MRVPAVVSIFSAPDHMDIYHNQGAFIRLKNSDITVQYVGHLHSMAYFALLMLWDTASRQYSASPHPYVLPEYIDAFKWSLPFAIDKMKELMVDVFSGKKLEDSSEVNSSNRPSDEPSADANDTVQRRAELGRRKYALNRMKHIFKIHR